MTYLADVMVPKFLFQKLHPLVNIWLLTVKESAEPKAYADGLASIYFVYSNTPPHTKAFRLEVWIQHMLSSYMTQNILLEILTYE